MATSLTDISEGKANTAQASELSQPRDTSVMPGFNSNGSWELAQRIGKAFSSSTLVPAAYQGNLANCIVALEMANRMGASPLMVMQNLYIVHGNPGWSSKFLIASFNQSGKFSAMRYEWNDARDECRAWATEKATGDRLVGPLVSVEMAKAEGWSTKSGSKWKTMPELMLMYRAAAFFVRTYAPEISMGLRTDDELVDTFDQPAETTSLDAVRAALSKTKPATIDMETGEITTIEKTSTQARAAEAAMGDKPVGKTYAQYADLLTKATSQDVCDLEIDEAKDVLPDDQYADLVKLYKTKFGK
jgi:hypothetical protein